MRLDAELRDFINATWTSVEDRQAVVELLSRLPEADRIGMVCTSEVGEGAKEAVAIATWVLVVTRDAIGYGWPMFDTLWRRSIT